MHFLLVGPGALGCLLASIAAKGLEGGDRLTILDYNGDRATYLTKQGIHYNPGDRQTIVPVHALSDPHLVEPVDVILLCVKSYDVASSLEFCRPVLSNKTLLVFMQNGIAHLSPAINPHEATIAFGTTTEGATLLGPGQVRHAGRGTTYLGFLETPSKPGMSSLQKTKDVLSSGGLQVQLADNILAQIWAKLFINAGINALTAILGCKNGELLTLPGVDERMEQAVGEAVRIAGKKNIPILGKPYEATRLVCRKTAQNVSSMLQDVRNRRKTEIDAINGAIVSLGRDIGIETPENSRLYQQLKELETGYARQ